MEWKIRKHNLSQRLPLPFCCLSRCEDGETSAACVSAHGEEAVGVQTSPELTRRKGQIPEGNSAVARGRH